MTLLKIFIYISNSEASLETELGRENDLIYKETHSNITNFNCFNDPNIIITLYF